MPEQRTKPSDQTKAIKQFTATVKDILVPSQTLTMVISDDSEDREGDIIEAAGWMLDAYRANPVVLFAHSYDMPAVGKSLETWIEGNSLLSTVQFAPTAMGQELWTLYSQGYMRAASVGFIPKRWEERENKGSWWPCYTYKEQELLEYSLVPVPANPNALAVARSKGLVSPTFAQLVDHYMAEIYPQDPNNRVQRTRQADLGDEMDYLKSLLQGANGVAPELEALAVELAGLLTGDRNILSVHGDDTAVTDKSGAVLSRKNKTALQQAQVLIQEVLDSAEPEEPAPEPSESEQFDPRAFAAAVAELLSHKE